jgi:hypothetical protein
MTVNLKIFDETSSGGVYNETLLRLASSRVRARDLIEQRVRAEVQKFNDSKANQGVFSGLVQPEGTEEVLNGYRFKKHKAIDADRQVQVALSAFDENRYFLLVDDRQVEELDEEFGVSEQTKVSFLRLVPLVGG